MIKWISLIFLFIIVGCSKPEEPVFQYKPDPIKYTGYQLQFKLEIDSTRAQYNVESIIPEKLLTVLAYSHAYDMNEKDEINHDFFTDRFILSYAVFFGEICAYNYQTAASEISAYENSPSHLNVIINPIYKYCGIAKVGKYQCVEFAGYENEKMKLQTITTGIETIVTINGGIITSLEKIK